MGNSTVLDSATQANVDAWLSGDYDAETKASIKALIEENPNELIDAFYTKLAFGTGGLRGIMGVGTNRMNVYTVRAATQGLANYINQQPKNNSEHKVIIGYDSRNHSRSFAEETAKVLAGNGIQVYLFNNLRPTPLVSFGCRYKHCIAGVTITASHNPPEYNGYKVYWQDGGQIVPPHDALIISEVNKIISTSQVKRVESLEDPLIELVEKEIDDAYLAAITPLQNYPKENHSQGNSLKIVYTSLHGTGITLAPQALSCWGFTNLSFVDKQIIPDGNFSTVKSPNPEEKDTLKMGLEKLQSENADILLATDPDADRVGVAVMHKGTPHILTGNQVACICLEHICEALTATNHMPAKGAFIKTIVTTELFQEIAKSYQKPCINVLTGFKYIAEQIHKWEMNSDGYQYIFGGEESYGYLLGTYTRDKDAISSSALISEVALHAKFQGKTLVDLLHDLYRKHGVFYETLLSMQFEDSKEGRQQITAGMKQIQHNPPKKIGNESVAVLEDYSRSIRINLKDNQTTPITLPKSDVLLFWLEDGCKLVIRPSGTEPKVKIYCGIKEADSSSIENALQKAEAKSKALVEALKQLFSS